MISNERRSFVGKPVTWRKVSDTTSCMGCRWLTHRRTRRTRQPPPGEQSVVSERKDALRMYEVLTWTKSPEIKTSNKRATQFAEKLFVS